MKLAYIPKTRFCTISEIVNRTGYGRATVHRALQNDITVKLEVREKIYHAIFDLNNRAIARYKAELRHLTQSAATGGA